MPLIPSTYATNSPISAHQLNQDLYSYDGSYFGANGVMFHANKPLLIESYATNTAIGCPKGGQFTVLGGAAGNAISILDNAALYGAGSDRPADSATFRSNGAVAPGSAGIAGLYGGWNLVVNFVPMGPFSGTNSAFGSAWYLGGSALQDIGPITPGSTVYDNAGFAVDLLNRAGVTQGQLAVAAWGADPAGRTNTISANTASTVGETARFTELWLGVNNGTGIVTRTVPVPMNTVTTSTTITSSTLNTSIQQTFNLLNYPPMLSINSAFGGSATLPLAGNTPTLYGWSGNTPLVDNFSAFSADTTNYVVPVNGIYFAHFTGILNPGGPQGQFSSGFQVNGTKYYGGWYNYGSLGNQSFGSAVTRVLDLNAGDTVACFMHSSNAQTFSGGGVPHWVMAYMSPISSGTQTWVPPEVTGFQFQAATPPNALPNLLNTKLANDINFLLNKPYLLARQTSAQTGLAVNTWQSITMNSVTGLIHSTAGDNYAGWSSGNNWYVAPVNGWYLAIAEIAAATQATVTGNHFTAGFSVPTSGGVNAPTSSHGMPDWYQALPVAQAGTWPTGATAIGCYYLNAGEHIAPYANYRSGTATTWNTDVSHGFQSHFEVFWVSN